MRAQLLGEEGLKHDGHFARVGLRRVQHKRPLLSSASKASSFTATVAEGCSSEANEADVGANMVPSRAAVPCLGLLPTQCLVTCAATRPSFETAPRE